MQLKFSIINKPHFVQKPLNAWRFMTSYSKITSSNKSVDLMGNKLLWYTVADGKI